MAVPLIDTLQTWVAIRHDIARMLGVPPTAFAAAAAGSDAAPGGVGALFIADMRASLAKPLSSVREQQRALVAGLQAEGIDLPSSLRAFQPSSDYAEQFDDGFEGMLGEAYLRGVRARDGDELSVTGVAGVPLTPQGIVIVAESVLTSVRQRPERPVLVVVDEGATTAGVDESRPLSEYLVHLARVLAWARSQAVAVNLWLYGGVTALTYAACAASASHVVAFPNAVLFKQGSAQAAGKNPVSGRQWVALGLIDECAEAGRRVGVAWNVSA